MKKIIAIFAILTLSACSLASNDVKNDSTSTKVDSTAKLNDTTLVKTDSAR